jgi:hypothetical protein
MYAFSLGLRTKVTGGGGEFAKKRSAVTWKDAGKTAILHTLIIGFHIQHVFDNGICGEA